MATPITNFREIVRVLIDDNDPDIQLRENFQIDAALKATVELGKVVGTQSSAYALDSGRENITPDLSATSDVKAFAQLAFHTAKRFLQNMTPTAWRTRAFSESVGDSRDRLFHLLDELYQLEHGDACWSSEYPES